MRHKYRRRRRARLKRERVAREFRMLPAYNTPIYARTTEEGWELFWALRGTTLPPRTK